MMLVASNNNSFDLWQKDEFFCAAEEVQQSVDIMESMYRVWLGERKEEHRGDLQIALGTSKWQLDEFERAVRLSSHRSQNNNRSSSSSTRRQQFIDVMEHQISRVEKELTDSLAQENQTLRWVNLDQQETHDLQLFLSDAKVLQQQQQQQSIINTESVYLGSTNTNFQGDREIKRKHANLESAVTSPEGLSDLQTSNRCYKQVLTIDKDSKYVVQLQPKDLPSTTCHDIISSSSSWKIVIADEYEDKNTLESHRRDNKPGHHFQTRVEPSCLNVRGIIRFTKIWKQLSAVVQRQLRYIRCTRFLQLMMLLLMMPTIFFITNKPIIF